MISAIFFTGNITSSSWFTHVFCCIYNSFCRSVIGFIAIQLVPCKSICWWYVLLFQWHGICYCWYYRSFSKTLLIFLLPQIINFVYSVPQLFHILPCPRHRLPRFSIEDGLMHPSFAELKKASRLNLAILETLSFSSS